MKKISIKIIVKNYLVRIFKLLNRIKDFVIFKIKYSNVRLISPRNIGTFYSQDGQDIFLASLLFGSIVKNPEPHWIVDVGCNHPINFSNSLFFERFFNCQVLAIDAIEEYEPLWRLKRPKAIFNVSAVGDRVGTVDLNLPVNSSDDDMFSFVDNGINKRPDIVFKKRTVSMLRLEDILLFNEIYEILLLSIDIEGYELNALKGIDFDKVLIRAIVLENNSHSLYGSDEIRQYLLNKDFIFYARIGYLDDIFIHKSMVKGV